MSEWIKINLPFGPIYGGQRQRGRKKATLDELLGEGDSFCKRGLNKPGTQIEMANGKQYIIGDINPLGGVCDDCMEFDKSDKVKRYRVLEVE